MDKQPTPISWEDPGDAPAFYKLPLLPVYAPMSEAEHKLRNDLYSFSRAGLNPERRSTRAG